jgi:hypothetical protein
LGPSGSKASDRGSPKPEAIETHSGGKIMAQGKGDLLESRRLRSDLRLVDLAVRKRWPISDEMKTELVEKLVSIAELGTNEEALRAISILIAVEAQNQKDDHLRGEARAKVDRLDEIAKDLGIEIE